MTRIKFVDLAAQNREIWDEVESALAEIHRTTCYIGGPAVTNFESAFSAYLDVPYTIGVGSGTDALRIAMIALGVGAGDEVITVPMTFIATAAAITQTGAQVTFVDIDPQTGNMSPDALRKYLEEGHYRSPNGPKAVMPVHLYGMPADMDSICAISNAHGLKVIEDACQAHGAWVGRGERKRAGTVGDAGCFSFYAGKNLGAWGEAGAIVTSDGDLASRAAWLRDHGRISHYSHHECGYNARLDAIQAAVLTAKLKYLDKWNHRRREVAKEYKRLLQFESLSLQQELSYTESCYHLFVVQTERRNALQQLLTAQQIDCGVHYPIPLHLQPAFSGLGYTHGDFPVSEEMADRVLSLPMHPHLDKEEIIRIADTVARFDNSVSGHKWKAGFDPERVESHET